MTVFFRRKASSALLIAALACLILSPLLSYKAGCAGDAKSGALGNAELALQYGGMAWVALLAGATIGAVSFLLQPAPLLSQRVARAGAWFIFGGIAAWGVAFEAEVWGVQSCF